MTDSMDQKIEQHRKYWNREDTQRPLVSVTIAEDFFFSRHYSSAKSLLEPGKLITPDMLDVPAFMSDYERMYNESLLVAQDGFWVGTPYTGIPWMEAMLGCEIQAMEASFVSKPTGATIENFEPKELSPENEWLAKYLEFTRHLVDLSDDRFPVGMPIMRGPSDMLGALLGQQEMVFALMLHPEKSSAALLNLTECFMKVIKAQEDICDDFHGGRSLGFYNVWAPGKCIWYQEDLSALLSPALFKQMLRPCGEYICKDYDYTAIHLHPSSFFIVDELLEMDQLKVIEINKDIGGPTIAETMELFQKVVERKNLIIWGELDEHDLEIIRKQLPSRGVYIHLIAESVERANQLIG
ncbi:MAG: hypothetical protein HKN69_13665, partial [Desulfofustis sp.]|nr:hypothetical protein [Desulfofustis sp.]